MPKSAKQPIAPPLLRWYDQNRRSLPWRAIAGGKPNPYHVWLSEIMLQQTTVPTVKNYFQHFIAKWPSVADLANASLDDVLHAWQGLGYYARARNLYKAAQIIRDEHNGLIPSSHADLLALPGIGPYTAGAIAAIAFNKPHAAVDANIERVMARLYAIKTPIKQAKKKLYQLVEQELPTKRPGDFLQALMDLGSSICTIDQPSCARCPLQAPCKANAQNIASHLPVKTRKAQKPVRRGLLYVVFNRKGEILLRRRPEKGMLGGMMELPGTAWDQKEYSKNTLLNPPHSTKWQKLHGRVRHSFTHYDLELTIYKTKSDKKLFPASIWVAPDLLSQYALPTLFKKALRQILVSSADS